MGEDDIRPQTTFACPRTTSFVNQNLYAHRAWQFKTADAYDCLGISDLEVQIVSSGLSVAEKALL